jgi:hypothetical protein
VVKIKNLNDWRYPVWVRFWISDAWLAGVHFAYLGGRERGLHEERAWVVGEVLKFR